MPARVCSLASRMEPYFRISASVTSSQRHMIVSAAASARTSGRGANARVIARATLRSTSACSHRLRSVAARRAAAPLRDAVVAARALQLERSGRLNSRLDPRTLWRVATLGKEERALLKRAADRWQLSARSSLRVLKVARTIADLEHSDRVSPQHVGEALQLRCRDRE